MSLFTMPFDEALLTWQDNEKRSWNIFFLVWGEGAAPVMLERSRHGDRDPVRFAA